MGGGAIKGFRVPYASIGWALGNNQASVIFGKMLMGMGEKGLGLNAVQKGGIKC